LIIISLFAIQINEIFECVSNRKDGRLEGWKGRGEEEKEANV
jgi:hypothetical protein